MNKINRQTKGRVLNNLFKKLKYFKVPITKLYTVGDWYLNEDFILDEITNFFSKKNFIKKIAIRSSSINEDNTNKSNAGLFYSELNINSRDKFNIKKSINKVVESFKKIKDSKKVFLQNEIIIQEMIFSSSLSGVAFTYDLNTGAPYYVINYDDVSGLTDTVTSGKNEHSNKSLIVSRYHISQLRSDRFIILIKAIKELEKKINSKYLDIEFVVKKNLEVYLLQVRPLNIKTKWSKHKEKNFKNFLTKTQKKIEKTFLKKNKKLFGVKTIYGQMPDWNPAEIIGTCPRMLSYSLYKKLITNNIWKKSRFLMGYNNPHEKNLMVSFGGQPYIDVRLSLNSFLPSKLPERIKEKLVNHWIEQLKLNPVLHDKIEFDLAITCFSFDLDKKIKNLVSNSLSKNEKKIYIESLKNHIKKLVNLENIQNLEKKVNKIENLKYDLKNFELKEIKKNINICITYGTLVFSMLARHGFIGKTLLLSLKENKILANKKIDFFLQSIKTITSEFLNDFNFIKSSKKQKKIFLDKYGHLRPGTYNILSKRYDQQPNLTDSKKKSKRISHNSFSLSRNEILKINSLLLKNNLINLNSDLIFKYIESSIKLREYSKFQFTKLLSHIIEQISNYGQKFKLNRDQLSHMSYENILMLHKLKKREVLGIINRNRENFNKTCQIKLPQLMSDSSAAYIIPFQSNKPNFVSNKKVIQNSFFLNDLKISKKLYNKIVLIESADPGYDWIFSYKIQGLITKYGGSNSHMAIRCAELSVPAAIGCGEQIFERLKDAPRIELDCAGGVVKSILD